MYSEKKRNVVLCGFMGSGKSTVGRILAKQAGRGFLDTDSYIINKYKMSIDEIFRQKGEAAFRAYETEVCRYVSGRKGLVVSVGGGTVLKEENVQLLKANGILVFLKVSPAVLIQRLSSDTFRPLLQGEDREMIINKLYDERLPVYEKNADLVVIAEKSPKMLAEDILKNLL